MSRAWDGGSTRRWRKLRLAIYQRDRGMCGLCGDPISEAYRSPHPRSLEVHHVLGKAVTGDDPRYLVAAHRQCNQAAGEPARRDPQPVGRTRW